VPCYRGARNLRATLWTTDGTNSIIYWEPCRTYEYDEVGYEHTVLHALATAIHLLPVTHAARLLICNNISTVITQHPKGTARLHLQSSRHFVRQPSARVSQIVLPSHMIAAASLTDEYLHLHRSDCRNTLIYTHATSCTLHL